MAYYDTKELEAKSLAAIKRYKCQFIQDVIAYLPCNSATFYNHGLEKLETIKDALEENRTKTKISLRKKWAKTDNATLQIALYKLIGTEDEAHRLNGSKQELKATVEGNFIKDLVSGINKIEGNDSDGGGNSDDQ